MTGKREGLNMSTTRVKTTLGLTLEVGDAELEDLRRQGLLLSGRKSKDDAAAPAASDDADAAEAEAETKGGAE